MSITGIFLTIYRTSKEVIIYNEIDSYVCTWLRNLIKAEAVSTGEVIEEDIMKFDPDLVREAAQFHAFAGLGIWSYALKLAGWPDETPVWTGSCPCQPFSAAGQRKGSKDARHLWPAWFSLIRECRPPVIFGEQVASRDGRAWLAAVQADLETLGYCFGAADLCVAGIGAPHIRQRLYFVAFTDPDGFQVFEKARIHDQGERRNDTAGCGESSVLADTSNGDGRSRERGTEAGVGENPEWGRRLAGGSASGFMGNAGSEGLSAREREGFQGQRGKQAGRAVVQPGGSSRIGGFWANAEWIPCTDGKARPIEPGTFPLAYGVNPDMGSDRPGEDSPFRVIKDPKTGRSMGQSPWRIGMLKGYGNAIVPQVAATFIKAVKGA